MKYRSTGSYPGQHTFDEVVLMGSAPDGKLFVPTGLPVLDPAPTNLSHQEYVTLALESFGATEVRDLVDSALSQFHHPEVAPLREIGDRVLLELFWGPTLSFKDHALQVLSRLVDRFSAESGSESTVLVATSGDTGSAAIEAFRGNDSAKIVVLYPEGLVTDFQRRQMTTVGDDNVTVVAVRGDFDDCQRLVKAAFLESPNLVSANSINWGRIAGQVGYYLSVGGRIGSFDVTIPTGNFGNTYSAWLARQIGCPIRRITVATNENRVLYDLQRTGEVRSAKTVATLAPAMDIQIPSNLDRYLDSRGPTSFADDFGAAWVSDAEILSTIASIHETTGVLIDPHTACAWAASERSSDIPSVVVGTAHPAKFSSATLKAVGVAAEIPIWAQVDDDLAEFEVTIEPELPALLELL